MNKFILSTLLVISINAVCSEFNLPAQDMKFKEYEQKGEIFTLKLIPSKKETKLFIVGNENASLKFDKIAITGKLRFGNNEKIIQFRREHDYFTTQDKLVGDSLQIHAETHDNKKVENFKFDIKKP